MSKGIKAAAIRKDGVVYTGMRHHEIINEIINNAAPPGSLRGGEQGFITYDGEFVNRRDAADIAFIHGQIHRLKKKLYSEDLW